MSFLSGTFNIPDGVIQEITSDLGVPIIDLSDIQLNDATVINVAIKPAMRLYFSYYPILLKQEYGISGAVNVPFPDDDVYGVSQARVSTGGGGGGGKRSGGSTRETTFTRTAARYGRTPAGLNPYYSEVMRVTEKASQQNSINLTKAGSFTVDYEERCLKGYSNVAGNLIVSWSKFSRNWEAIRFHHEMDVIDVAKMNILRFIGNIRSQLDPNTGVTSDGAVFLNRADDIENRIIKDKWKNIVPVVVLH